MSIYPNGKKPDHLRYKFEIAAIDVPVPADLTNSDDVLEWYSYCDCLSPAQRVRKFGQALDQFHALIGNTDDPLTLPEKQQEVLYSKWYAASIVNSLLHKNFDFETEETFRGKAVKSDIEKGLYCIIDFLRSVNSADLSDWETRRKQHQALDRNDEKFSRFLSVFSSSSGRKQSKGPSNSP